MQRTPQQSIASFFLIISLITFVSSCGMSENHMKNIYSKKSTKELCKRWASSYVPGQAVWAKEVVKERGGTCDKFIPTSRDYGYTPGINTYSSTTSSDREQTFYQTVDDVTYGSDGTIIQRVGDTTFGSNGTMCQSVGDTIFCY